MADSMRENIELFHKANAFNTINGITPLSPVKVMLDLNNEVKTAPEELYTLATKLIDGIYNSEDPFLYGERIAAIKTIAENGFYHQVNYPEMTPEQAFGYLLQCSTESFITLVDSVAKTNQDYYTAEWGPETNHDEVMENLFNSMEEFLDAADGTIRAILVERDYKGQYERFALTPKEFQEEYPDTYKNFGPIVMAHTDTIAPLVHIWFEPTVVGSPEWNRHFTDMEWGLSQSDIESGNLAYVREDFMKSLRQYLPKTPAAEKSEKVSLDAQIQSASSRTSDSSLSVRANEKAPVPEI